MASYLLIFWIIYIFELHNFNVVPVDANCLNINSTRDNSGGSRNYLQKLMSNILRNYPFFPSRINLCLQKFKEKNCVKVGADTRILGHLLLKPFRITFKVFQQFWICLSKYGDDVSDCGQSCRGCDIRPKVGSGKKKNSGSGQIDASELW